MTDKATVPMTLVDRVEAIIDASTDMGRGELYNVVSARPERIEGEGLTTYELDLRDWGALVGLAYGIARTEEACESLQSVGARALAVAEAVWDRRLEGNLDRPGWARKASREVTA